MDLAHVLSGYIQVEETDFRRSTDRQVYQKLGSNINYLLDQAISVQALTASVFANTVKAFFTNTGFTTDTSGNFGGVLDQSPNGKQILFAACFGYIAGHRNPWPLHAINGAPLVTTSLFTGNGTGQADNGSPFPQVQVQIVGPNNNQLYCNIVNGSTTGTKGTSPTWPGFTGGFLSYTLVYQT